MMNDHLSAVERRLIGEILKQHGLAHHSLADQLDRLRVIDREPTVVGAYINFSLLGPVVDDTISTQLGFDGKIEIDGVPSGLGCVLLVDAGRMYYLELFTYGNEKWDGNLDNARIIPAKSDPVKSGD
jgi:hypothetical protein